LVLCLPASRRDPAISSGVNATLAAERRILMRGWSSQKRFRVDSGVQRLGNLPGLN
jgi:hypothetical protein